MAVQENANISASLTGLDGVLGGLGQIKSAGGAISGALKNVVTDGLRAAGVFQAISLASAVEDVKKLDATTARLGQSSGSSVGALQAKFAGLEQKLLTSAPALADFTQQLGRTTYDSKSAASAVEGLGLEALATGKTLSEEMSLGETLRSGLGVIGETTAELDRLRAMAGAVQTVGGPAAFQASLISLRSQLEGVETKSDSARAKLEAFVAATGKGLKPGAQAGAAGGLLSFFKSRSLDIERLLKRRVINDAGELIDPSAIARDLKKVSDKLHGGRKEEQRRALINTYGLEGGLAMFRGDFADVDSLAKLKGTGQTAAAAQRFRETDAAKRIEFEVGKQSAMRAIGSKFLGVHDSLVGGLGTGGALGVELVGGHLGAKGLGKLSTMFGGGGAGAAAEVAKLGDAARTTTQALTSFAAIDAEASAAAGGLTKLSGALIGAGGLVVGAASAALQLKVLSEIGQDRDEMGKQWRKEHGLDDQGRPIAPMPQDAAFKAASEGTTAAQFLGGGILDTLGGLFGDRNRRAAPTEEITQTELDYQARADEAAAIEQAMDRKADKSRPKTTKTAQAPDGVVFGEDEMEIVVKVKSPTKASN